jgi:hypothetical protein
VTSSITIPIDYAGTFTVRAISKDSSGAVAPPDELNFIVVPTATLNSMSVSPDPVWLQAQGESQVLLVIGHYADGTDRYITRAAAGTQYSTANAAVATVSASGNVTAEGDGLTTITVQNAGVSADVAVDVDHSRFWCTTDASCDDSEPCTINTCTPGVGMTGCQIQVLSGACDDSDPCTQSDVCIDGACSGTPLCGNGVVDAGPPGCEEQCDGTPDCTSECRFRP